MPGLYAGWLPSIGKSQLFGPPAESGVVEKFGVLQKCQHCVSGRRHTMGREIQKRLLPDFLLQLIGIQTDPDQGWRQVGFQRAFARTIRSRKHSQP